MKKSLLFFLVNMIIVFVACKGPAENEMKDAAVSADKRNIYTADDGHTTGINVNLNNGAKWEANVETTQGMGAMLGMVGDMPGNPTLEDYRALHEKLLTSFQSILQKCTMTGEAHNQLHNYLIPLKEKIEKLKEGDLETCKRVVPDIKDYLLKYSHFFFT
jgi:hypothetical protein